MNLNTLRLSKFWNELPLISSLLIAASVLMYLGWLVDHSFFDLAAPSLDDIRNGSYWGLLTGSLFENNIIFLVWGIGWIWYFGKSIESRFSLSFFALLITSSMVFPILFRICIFETIGPGMGGIIYSLFGFMWIMSVYEPSQWSDLRAERLVLIAFIFLCILLNYTGLYKLDIAALVGGLMWGLCVGFVSNSIRIKALRVAIPTLVLGLFLIPVFWAPWQVSWLLNKAEKYRKQGQLLEQREFYSRVLNKDPENETAKKNISLLNLFEEYRKYYDQGDIEKAKKNLLQILEIVPDDKDTKHGLKVIQLYEDYLKYYEQQDFDRAESALSQILEMQPDDENTKKNLRRVKLWNEFFKSLKNNDSGNAENALSQILAMDPNNETAQRYLKESKNKTKSKRAY